MEIWRIVIFAVVYILCAIGGVWYIIRLKLQETGSKTYVYPKTGHEYMPLYSLHPVSGEWFNALIYKGMNDGELYVREYKDFFDKFVKLLDWENENVSANKESRKS
jgi:hypothetical protein